MLLQSNKPQNLPKSKNTGKRFGISETASAKPPKTTS